MTINTLLMKAPLEWDAVTRSLSALCRGRARDIRYIGDFSDLSSDHAVVDVVVMKLHGAADYALEVYGKDVLDLPDDTVGMHVAVSIGCPVIISGPSPDPELWRLLSPDGKIEDIKLDITALDENSRVEYRLTEPPAAGDGDKRRA